MTPLYVPLYPDNYSDDSASVVLLPILQSKQIHTIKASDRSLGSGRVGNADDPLVIAVLLQLPVVCFSRFRYAFSLVSERS